MPKEIKSKKFIAPPVKEDKKRKCTSSGDGKDSDSGLSEVINSKACVSRSMSDSQYDDLFSSVIGHTETDIRGKQGNDHRRTIDNTEEDEVVVPEPNAALSPAESAEEGCESTGSAVKTPDQRIDNSVLPPVKRKKPSSKIARLKLKIKPTRLNFDDPAVMGESDNLPKPKKSKSLPSKTSQIPKTSSKTSDYKDLQKPYKPDSKKKSCPKTPDVREILQNEFRTPTGRAISDSQLSTGSIGRGANPRTPSSSQLLCSQTSSIQAAVLSPRSKLFRLHRKRNVGLWVQCTNKICNKWRYLPSTRDPTEVPDNWQCFMNHDKKYGSCSVPEKGPTPVEEEDLIHNIYTAGSIVWGRLHGYPWWPAMVDDDPDVEQYYWITENCDIPTHYNVTFFDDKPVTRAWLPPGAMTKFSQPECCKDVFKTSARGTDYKRRLEVAKRQANEALKLSVDERLKIYSFPARYKGPIGKKRYPSDSEDDEAIQRITSRAGKVPKKDKNISEEDPMKDIMESLEVVKEVNEVLNELMSKSGSEDGEKSEEGTSRTKNSEKGKKKGKLHSVGVPNKDKGKKCTLSNDPQKAKKDIKSVSDIKEGGKDSKNLKDSVAETAELKMKKPKKGKNGAMNKERNKEGDEKTNEVYKGKEISNEPNQEMKQGEKKEEGVRKAVNKNEDEKAKGNKKKNDKMHQGIPKEVKAEAHLKQRKVNSKDEDSAVRHAEISSKDNQNQGKQKNDQHNKIAATNILVDDDKTSEKTDEKDQRDENNSEAIGEEGFYAPSSTNNLTSAQEVHPVNNEDADTVESKNRSDVLDAEDSVSEVVGDSESDGDDEEKEDETSSSEQESDDYSNSNSEGDESDPKPSQIKNDSCGRSSADLFEPQQCNPEQLVAGSQLSADFEVEE